MQFSHSSGKSKIHTCVWTKNCTIAMIPKTQLKSLWVKCLIFVSKIGIAQKMNDKFHGNNLSLCILFLRMTLNNTWKTPRQVERPHRKRIAWCCSPFSGSYFLNFPFAQGHADHVAGSGLRSTWTGSLMREHCLAQSLGKVVKCSEGLCSKDCDLLALIIVLP